MLVPAKMSVSLKWSKEEVSEKSAVHRTLLNTIFRWILYGKQLILDCVLLSSWITTSHSTEYETSISLTVDNPDIASPPLLPFSLLFSVFDYIHVSLVVFLHICAIDILWDFSPMLMTLPHPLHFPDVSYPQCSSYSVKEDAKALSNLICSTPTSATLQVYRILWTEYRTLLTVPLVLSRLPSCFPFLSFSTSIKIILH